MQNKPLSVSQLNTQVRLFLETEIGSVQVEGEVSNLTKAGSGHFYFSLKDDKAQIRCVHFKNRHSRQSHALCEGQQIVAHGKLSIYEARGDYQLIVDSVTEAGLGKLFQEFEALKKKLAAEGLFDSQKKKPLPAFPQTIAVITSPTGAAIRDIFATLDRRYPYANILVYPSEVQGATASRQLIAALSQAIKDKRADVIILARGGGSLEDLWSFNDEQLARLIAACPIPIVSGVGHETDFSIADFAADLRAATPTAAAEAVSPDRFRLIETFDHYQHKLTNLLTHLLKQHQLSVQHARQKIASPGKVIFSHWQSLDYLLQNLERSLQNRLKQKQHQLQLCTSRLERHNPSRIVHNALQNLKQQQHHLQTLMQKMIQKKHEQLNLACKTLHTLSPLATLDRGYAIASHRGKLLFSSKAVKAGDLIAVRLSKGMINCSVINTGD